MKISPARISAFEILLRVETGDAFSSVLLPAETGRLADRDRSLCYELTLGCLRRQILLDAIIDKFAKGKKLDPAVRVAARLGIYQLRFLDRIPEYSAINESVHLVGKAGKASAKGFVNALLRNEERKPADLQFADESERISVQTSHPKWLIEKWITALGAATAEGLALANNEIPAVTFRLTASTTDVGRSSASRAKSSTRTPGCYTAGEFDASLLSLAASGEIYFQDEASQMTAGAVLASRAGRVLDVCAAPGSKTTLIGATRGRRLLVAGDLHASRISLLRSTCRKQNVDAEIVQYDAEVALPFAEESFDTVLVDAPCSGTGTIRHNPEIRYRVTSADFAQLAKKQLAILRNASNLVKRGGGLIYSTCSIEREENEDVCRDFEGIAPGFDRTNPHVPEKFITPDLYARTFPHTDGMDGFFIASFVRSI